MPCFCPSLLKSLKESLPNHQKCLALPNHRPSPTLTKTRTPCKREHALVLKKIEEISNLRKEGEGEEWHSAIESQYRTSKLPQRFGPRRFWTPTQQSTAQWSNRGGFDGFWRFRRSWRFQSWRLPPLKLNPPFPWYWYRLKTWIFLVLFCFFGSVWVEKDRTTWLMLLAERSEAWEPSQFQDKTLSEWKGHSRSNSRNSRVFSEQLLELVGSQCVFFTYSWGLFTYGSSFLHTVGEL